MITVSVDIESNKSEGNFDFKNIGPVKSRVECILAMQSAVLAYCRNFDTDYDDTLHSFAEGLKLLAEPVEEDYDDTLHSFVEGLKHLAELVEED